MPSKNDAYPDTFAGRLAEWNARTDRPQARAAHASAQAKIEYERELRDLRGRRDRLRDRLQAVKDAGQQHWDARKKDLDRTRTDVQQAVASVPRQ